MLMAVCLCIFIGRRADLVPVFSFGENDVSGLIPSASPFIHPLLVTIQIYQQMPNEKGTTIHTLQKKFQNVFGFTLPLFHGRGVFNCELVVCQLHEYNIAPRLLTFEHV